MADAAVTANEGQSLEDGHISLGTLEDYFTDSSDDSREAREKSERSRDYYDNEQLTTAEKDTLSKRNQPQVVFNRIGPKVDFLLGFERQNRTDPKAFPRTPNHDEAANAVTDAIRYVLDNDKFDIKASQVFENMIIEGFGGCTVEVAEKRDDLQITVNYVRWDRIFYDPYSVARDFSDARYMGIVIWKDLSDAKAEWPDSAADLQGQMDNMTLGTTYDDTPDRFFDKTRDRVQCIDIWYKWEQTWHHAIFAQGVWLEPPEQSTYLDDDGMPANPMILTSTKVKREGQRYGTVEALIDIQDEINKRRSKMLHILNTKQTFSKEGQIMNINDFKKEANKSDGHLEFPNAGTFGTDFGIIPNENLVGPQFSMYQDAIQQIDAVQANAALAGKTEGTLSGRAIQSLQQGGMIELTPVFDTHAQWKNAIYRAVWDRIRQFWKEERWVRVTDDEENLKFVGLNQPVSLAEQRIADQLQIKPEDVRSQFPDELAEIHRLQPELAEVAEVENNVAEIDVDIIIEEVPDVTNLQSEQFDLLVKIYQANPDAIDFEDIIAMSTLRNKNKILKRDLSPEEEAAAQQQQAKQDEADAIAREGAAADVGATKAKTLKDTAGAAKDQAAAEETQLTNAQTRAGIKELLEFVNR